MSVLIGESAVGSGDRCLEPKVAYSKSIFIIIFPLLVCLRGSEHRSSCDYQGCISEWRGRTAVYPQGHTGVFRCSRVLNLKSHVKETRPERKRELDSFQTTFLFSGVPKPCGRTEVLRLSKEEQVCKLFRGSSAQMLTQVHSSGPRSRSKRRT